MKDRFMNYYVIGDVHGEYRALLNLISKIPKDSQLVFVGDLIDRGAQSAHVIRFIREHKLPCVKGNHEVMMIEYGSKFIKEIKSKSMLDQDNMWLEHGGKETLISYGLVTIQNKKIVPHPFIEEFIFQFENDIEWMKKLPIYLELDTTHISNRKVVVSHSAIAPVWKMKKSKEIEKINKFNNVVLWGRVKPIDSEPIFNIFGHTPQQYSADMKRHYVNIDTGCYMKTEKGFGLLSAYCVETEEVYSSGDLSYEKVS
jgi:serine/threonine protein phosphatase 1